LNLDGRWKSQVGGYRWTGSERWSRWNLRKRGERSCGVHGSCSGRFMKDARRGRQKNLLVGDDGGRKTSIGG
jgi:hypothetical protein